jgi:hypothetical protein
MGQVFFTGVSHAESDVAGTPRTMSGKLARRTQNRQSDLGLQGRRQLGPAWLQMNLPFDPQTGRAMANLDPKLNALRLSKAAAIGFAEIAGRLKAMADVGIKTLAYGMDMTRTAAVMAWREGLPIDSAEFRRSRRKVLALYQPEGRTREGAGHGRLSARKEEI